MTCHLPPNLKILFQARPPLPYKEPLDLNPKERKGVRIDPLGHVDTSTLPPLTAKYLPRKIPKDAATSVLANLPAIIESLPPYIPTDTIDEQKRKKKAEHDKAQQELLEKNLAEWNPKKDENAVGDPYKTLFVGRLSYTTTEKVLLREFERHGAVKSVSLVTDVKGKSRGYAFIEFERERDLKSAFREADGVKIDGRRIVVDVERGRTVKTWKPRRLGGGLGGTRLGGKNQNRNFAGRDDPDRRPMSEMDRRGGNFYGGGGPARYDRAPPRRDKFVPRSGPPRGRSRSPVGNFSKRDEDAGRRRR